MAGSKKRSAATAETLAARQREISVSEFFLKNRHLLGFDNPRKALLTTVKEAVDNALDACEEAGVLPEVGVEIVQLAQNRFRIEVTDNGPGVVRAQIPRIFAKLLYGSKFHRLRMSRGQQGIGISAAGMYGQLTTGKPTRILSKTARKKAHEIEVHIDTRKNKPAILRDEQTDWQPEFQPLRPDGKLGRKVAYTHGTCVSIELEANYVRGHLSVDTYLKQCAIVNPHLQLHYRLVLRKGKNAAEPEPEPEPSAKEDGERTTYARVLEKLPEQPQEIKPHPHGVELGMLMQMLKETKARTLRAALSQDFSRVGSGTALRICEQAGLSPKARPTSIAHRESEALYQAIQETKLMRPPTDCLAPIGEEQVLAGLKKEIPADFYTAVTRPPTVYRGNPFQVELGLAYARPGSNPALGAESPIRLMRFANRVPLLYMAGGCAISRAVTGVNWKAYGMSQQQGALPIGPMSLMVHIASVWVPFTSESKEAIAHYPEIVREITFAAQECGRRLAVYVNRRRRQAEIERKRSYIEQYIPHLALGLKEILDLSDRQEKGIVNKLGKMLARTHLET